MIDSKALEDFLEIEKSQSRGCAAEMSMVGGNKFCFTKSALDHLNISQSEIKNVRLTILVNHKNKTMMIRRSPNMNMGHLLSGTPARPECYCADKCQAVLHIMHKYLTGSGTVRFLSIEHEFLKLEDTQIPVLLVDLNIVNANPGVLEEMED